MDDRFGPIMRIPRALRGKFKRPLKKAYLESGELLDILKNVRHPNIMSVYEYDENYIYVEFIDGLVLSNRSPACPPHHQLSYLDLAEDIDLAPIGDAIRHLHDNGISHSDITSHNILVTTDGTLKLIDLTCSLPRRKAFVQRDWRMFAALEEEIAADTKGSQPPGTATSIPAKSRAVDLMRAIRAVRARRTASR